MHKTILGLAIVGLCISGGQAQACDGSNIIFEDKFEDDAGGWSNKEAIEVRDGAFVFTLPPDDLQSNLNVTFTLKDADICAEAVWPESGDQPMLGAALLFWGENNRTYYQFGILNNGRFWISRKQDGAWFGTIAANIPSSNTLRVDAKGDSLEFYINGTKVRALRGQSPSGGWRFGLSGDNFDKMKDATVLFTNMKVTD